MGFSARLSAGWDIALNSFKVLRENKQLIIFPLLSGISIILVLGSFITILLANTGWDIDALRNHSRLTNYAFMFGYYVFNYFIIVFFNTALIHCTRLYFRGEEVTISKGLQFSMSRIRVIFLWALFAGTVGTALRIIQENVGWLGKILTGIGGVVWSIATFFVVPVIAFENLGPFAAFKRSSQLMKQKWGESLGAGFSFGLIELIALLVIAGPLFLIGFLIHPFAGFALAAMGVLTIVTVMSAVHTIFISAVYHNVTGDPVEHVNQQLVDNLFVYKK